MQNSATYLVAASVLLAALAGIVIYRWLAGRSFLDRLVPAITPLLLLAAALRILIGVTARPFSEWDTVRLTPVFALSHGYPLYPTPETGPLISFCYGPVSALVYLPVVFSPTPTLAVFAAASLTVILLLAPVLWIHLDCPSSGTSGWTDRLVSFLAFLSFVFLLPSLSYSLFSPAHDAVALALGAVATAILCRHPSNAGAVPHLVSALIATLSVWAKQTMIALLFALPLYLLIAGGVRNCRRYVAFLVMWGIVATGVFVIAFDRDGMLLNMFQIPLRHVRDKRITEAIWSFQFELPVVAILLIFGLTHYYSEMLLGRPAGHSESMVRRRWPAFVILGVLQIPAVLAAYTKLGGGENAFSFSLYYLAIGATVLVSEIRDSASADESRNAQRRVAQGILVSFSCVLLLAPVLPLRVLEKATYPDPLKAAFEFEKKYPGRAYFPWNTLSVLMAGGTVYHAEDGIQSLTMAGRDLSIDEFRAHVPAGATLLALPPNYPAYWTNHRILPRALPEFRRQITIEELPGWSVYERVTD